MFFISLSKRSKNSSPKWPIIWMNTLIYCISQKTYFQEEVCDSLEQLIHQRSSIHCSNQTTWMVWSHSQCIEILICYHIKSLKHCSFYWMIHISTAKRFKSSLIIINSFRLCLSYTNLETTMVLATKKHKTKKMKKISPIYVQMSTSTNLVMQEAKWAMLIWSKQGNKELEVGKNPFVVAYQEALMRFSSFSPTPPIEDKI